ncbi:MAG: tetratricopeptide repeat protein [Glaciecola sp.]|jgi:tetratricopeptide (TPR) repeat protein
MNGITPTPIASQQSEKLEALIDQGQFKDALDYALDEWGPMQSWQTIEQRIYSIKLSYHLGGDRLSDAILLRTYRENKQSTKILDRMMYYKLSHLGLILGSEFMQEHEQTMLADHAIRPQFYAFKSIISREQKDFEVAEKLLEAAQEESQKNANCTQSDMRFYRILKVRLLLEQDRDEDALNLAQELFSAEPTVGTLRVYIQVVQKIEDLKAGTNLLKAHIERFQSCLLWMQLASMSATELDWDTCQVALKRHHELKVFDDKYDKQRAIAYEGQIKLHHGDYEAAREILSKHKSKYWQIVCENLAKHQELETDKATLGVKVLDVPFYRQEHLTCAPTTLSAIAAYFGKKHDSKSIADEICYSGTPDTSERRWLRENNFYFVEFDLQEQYLTQLIDSGVPFGLVTTSAFSAHLQAVIGYNSHTGSMFTMDPGYSGMQEMLIKETLESEAFAGARCVAFVPREKQDLLTNFVPSDHAFYELWDKYMLAKELNDVAVAKQFVEALHNEDAQHRLSVKARRDYALWSGQLDVLQELNESLLEQHPDQTILLSSQYYCLRDLGRREEALNKLATYLDKNKNLYLSRVLFDEIYDTNERPELSKKLLTFLKKYGSYIEEVYQSLAHYYWNEGERVKALTHYRIAFCMDDTSEAYVESYFKASRFLQGEDEVLAFLTRRFNKYIKRSPLPAISLLRAYELSNEEHKGIEFLEQALVVHPHHITLLNTLGSKLITYGQLDKFESYREQFERYLSADDVNYLNAKYQVRQGALQDALPLYKALFEQSPLQSKTADAYFGLLQSLSMTKELDDELNKAMSSYPDNATVQDYLIYWHSDAETQKRTLERAISHRPDNGSLRRQLIDKLIYLGQKERALTVAKESFLVLPKDIECKAYLARANAVIGNFDEAKDIAKSVLMRNIDNDLAFNVLMTSSRHNDDKIESLQFVFEQIKLQVVFGDSAWNYWFEACRTVSDEVLQSFTDYLISDLPHLWYAYAINGFYQKQQGHLDKALEYFQKGIEKFPFTPRLHKEEGHLYELLEQTEAAKKSYFNALEINPGWSEVVKLIVDLFEKEMRFDEAINVLKKALKHTHDDGILHGYLADLYLQKNDDESAYTCLEKAVEHQADYNWAWHQISQIGDRTDRPSLAVELARELSEKYPYLAQAWCNLSAQSEDRDEKLAYIRKAIAVNPLFQNAYSALADFYREVGDYHQALAVFKDTPWNGELPFQLASLQAQIYAQTGQYENAAQVLQNLLSGSEGNSHLWQKLYEWLYQLDRKSDIVKASYKQIELNKHDANSLCIASEMLSLYGGEQDKLAADQHLLRAHKLAPNDQYITLTLADALMEKGEFDEALSTLIDFERFSTSPFATARKVMCHLELEEQETALSLYKDLLNDLESDYWSLNKPFEAMIRKLGFNDAISIYTERLSELNEVQAYVWADNNLTALGVAEYKKLLKEIKEIKHEPLHAGAIRAIFEAWNDQHKKGDKKVIQEYEEIICRYSPVFEQASMQLIARNDYQTLINLYDRFENVSDLSMFSYYQVRCAYQLLNQWDKAGEVIRLGIQQQPDNSLQNMKLWYFYELWRTGHIFSDEELSVIDYHELIEIERYVFATLKVAVKLGERDLESCLDDITPELRKCQQDNQEVSGHPLASAAQSLLKERLLARVSSSGFFSKLLIKWKLSNRF